MLAAEEARIFAAKGRFAPLRARCQPRDRLFRVIRAYDRSVKIAQQKIAPVESGLESGTRSPHIPQPWWASVVRGGSWVVAASLPFGAR